MKEFLYKLFTYDEWAIARSLSSLQGAVNPEAQLMLSHILSAENIWMTRLRGEDSSTIPVFEEFSLEECARMSDGLHREYLAYIDSLAESAFDTLVSYKNTKGDPFQTSVKDILTHVGLHGVYHRGQVALLVRQGGGSAVATDYIIFTRV
jgi:uncharacterized damage-inducible protein DinB